jgi:5-methylcytosine-specific restriction endonuclease McrA
MFTALAEGRVHLTGLGLLAPHVTAANVEALLEAATHKSKVEIQTLIAHHFPQPDVPTRVRAVPERGESLQPVAVQVQAGGAGPVRDMFGQHAPAHVANDAPKFAQAFAQAWPTHDALPSERTKVTPLTPQRFALQVTISKDTHDKLRRAQELLSHAVPSGNVAIVLDRALDALITRLEKNKFAETHEPRPQRQCTRGTRTIPAAVRRAVRARDGRQCTFVSDTGHRCTSRKFLEFDHVEPVARGGDATVDNVRLRCRAHNQYEAEQVFGDGFMHGKREARRFGGSRDGMGHVSSCARGLCGDKVTA